MARWPAPAVGESGSAGQKDRRCFKNCTTASNGSVTLTFFAVIIFN
jgi:hypothetical protein